MGNPVEIEITPPHDLRDLIAAVEKKRPDPAAVAEYAEQLDAHPDLTLALSNVTSWVENGIIKTLGTMPKSIEVALQKRPAVMRAKLGYQEASPLERLLIDHVVTCWLRQQEAEIVYTSKWKGGMSLAQAGFWERRLSATQRRYLRACET